MSKMTETLTAGAQWYNDRPIRERALMVVTACVLVFVLGWELVVAPVQTRQQQLDNRLQSLSAERDALLSQQQTLNSQLASDPSEELRQRLTARQGRLDRLDQQITKTAGQLITPRDMVTLLRTMLSAQQQLELESMVLMAPVPVFDGRQGGNEEAEPEPLLYAHDVELKIQGSYLHVLAYLQRLEAMDERLGWMQLEYQAGTWPKGEASIRVRTLSLEAAWLGV
ncbi:MAG: MSHA biogenesis protein MshJ [Marinobacter excellens HL-55]|uniref:MSHA biogenesis protein MshJ n=1 Tax=Marinobacter excellens HL-55 TaxID=1305731 RepID=A0A0P8B365_9GAMM|nr:MAG: MSHA biogenesis protein MshJ [Marinobacter excellens HL-55]